MYSRAVNHVQILYAARILMDFALQRTTAVPQGRVSKNPETLSAELYSSLLRRTIPPAKERVRRGLDASEFRVLGFGCF